MSAIAFLGLGAMGSRMAAHLITAGHQVSVWNRDAAKAQPLVDKGATLAATPRAAATGAEFVIAMLRDDDASQQVWLAPETGALAAMRSDAVAIECSTLTTAWINTLHTQVQQHGATLIDAPVVGSRPQAEAAQLIFLAGGDADVLARIQALLGNMGAAIHHAGASGAGASIKLAINALFALQVAGLAEVLAFLKARGISPQQAIDIMGSTPVLSLAAKGAAMSMANGNFAPMFPVELVEKDLAYLHAGAEQLQQQVPLANATQAVMQRAIAQGMAHDNLTGICRLYL